MLDLNAIRARAAERLAQCSTRVANPANPANDSTPEAIDADPISQLATLATHARAVGKWTDRLNAKNAAPPYTPTAKTDKRGSEGASGSFGSAPRGGCAIFPGPPSDAAAANLADLEAFEERAAILEFDAGLPRAEAEAQATAMLAPAATTTTTRTCRVCVSRLPAGNCDKPIEAGLIDGTQGWQLAWGDDEHAARCRAFAPRMPAEATERPYRLAKSEGDAA